MKPIVERHRSRGGRSFIEPWSVNYRFLRIAVDRFRSVTSGASPLQLCGHPPQPMRHVLRQAARWRHDMANN